MTDVRMHAAAFAATLALTLASALGAPAAESVDLQVMIPNLKPDGVVVIDVYNDPGAWLAVGKPYRRAVVAVANGMAAAQFKAPAGRYAVAVFQDKDGDGQLDMLPFKWPLERVGYSGGDRPLFGRPSWDKADFGLTGGERTTVFVRLK